MCHDIQWKTIDILYNPVTHLCSCNRWLGPYISNEHPHNDSLVKANHLTVGVFSVGESNSKSVISEACTTYDNRVIYVMY